MGLAFRLLRSKTSSVGFSAEALDGVFVALDELDLDAELARRLLNLGLEEEIVDEAENAGRRVFPDGRGRQRKGV
jgi:hypothetical protein